jgi:hypothetical protein
MHKKGDLLPKTPFSSQLKREKYYAGAKKHTRCDGNPGFVVFSYRVFVQPHDVNSDNPHRRQFRIVGKSGRSTGR